MAIVHYLMKKRRTFTVMHYIHAESEVAQSEYDFVSNFCVTNEIPLLVGKQEISRPKGMSREEFWRHGRYEFFRKFGGMVLAGHNLDDALEWYLFSSFQGLGKFMSYDNGNVIRPLLVTKKSDIVEYARVNNIPHFHDWTNDDVTVASRNRIRHNIVPEALKVNPGLYTTVKRKIRQKAFEESEI